MTDEEREQLRDNLQAAMTAVFQGMRLDQERIAELELALVRARREREAAGRALLDAEARFAKVPALVEALRYIASDERTPMRLERMAKEAVAEWERSDECGEKTWRPDGYAICRGPRDHDGGHVWEAQ